jgi:peptidoglycan lytic transglycosylase G
VNLGVVASVRAFSNAAKASGHGSSLEPGYYRMHKHMAATLAFALLLKPSSRIQLTVVIPEGRRLSEIIAALGKATGNPKGYQQAIKDVSGLDLPSYAKGNPEGYLFPATYKIQPGTPPIEVLRTMVQRFKQEAQAVNLSAVAVHDQISEGDAIIVASLVQAEGRRPQDLAKIARVIYNRLNVKMNLQLDTTVLYALNSRAADVTVAQTKNTRSRYNTYLHVGLPPGPIDSPGHAAIHAALHPTPGHHDWLYFLTVNPKTGLTKFTNSFAVFQTYEQQLAAYNASHH